MRSIISRKIVGKHEILQKALGELLILTQKVTHEGMEKVVVELINQLESPFTFVIVGEVKAGKSSFVNALLESQKEICKVAASPMTDTIQQITYGEKESVEMITENVKKIYQPIDILKEITIVDTPGTNTIVEHHQEITERFIPHSDLIVFVFEAKNPYRESAWEFFNYINEEWRRKIIFVLQQKDLMEPEDLKVNINGVTEYAIKKGIKDPVVFAVSAKQELEGQKEESGFDELRSYMEKNITGGQAPALKHENNRQTALQINENIREGLTTRQKQYEADVAFRKDITKELNEQKERSLNQANTLVENLIAAYDRITSEKTEKLQKELSFLSVLSRSIRSVFTQENNLKEFLSKEAKDLEYILNIELKDRLNTGIIDVADQIQMMCKVIDGKLKSSTTILKQDDELFAHIAERRSSVLKELQQSFQNFLQKTDNFYDENISATSSNVGSDLAAGGGLAVVGVILTALTNGAVFDITGGILTAIGVIFAGASLGFKRGKLIRQFKDEVKKGRIAMKEEVITKLSDYIYSISKKMDDIFVGLDEHIEKEEKSLKTLQELSDNIKRKLDRASL